MPPDIMATVDTSSAAFTAWIAGSVDDADGVGEVSVGVDEGSADAFEHPVNRASVATTAPTRRVKCAFIGRKTS